MVHGTENVVYVIEYMVYGKIYGIWYGIYMVYGCLYKLGILWCPSDFWKLPPVDYIGSLLGYLVGVLTMAHVNVRIQIMWYGMLWHVYVYIYIYNKEYGMV